MEIDFSFYDPDEYIITQSGNKVSRKSILCGSKHIVLLGKVIIQNESVIRGDLAAVRIGEYSIISQNVVLRPPFKKYPKGVAFFPLYIGNNVFIGENSVINAIQIGSYVHIGKNCIIGRRALLKDCCFIADDTVIPPETVVSSFKKFGGSPAQIDDEDLPECTQHIMTEKTLLFYHNFIPNTKQSLNN
ncbi:unnamed protein product [Gordionus sp. m RMFG-2023]|uniref:dynactin subunit 5-like n=1 Tax=Gordionus sp. m RMFG-2023 TaxID=3053472 RepID=UPI0030DEAE77